MTRITRHRFSCLLAAFLLLSLAPAAADARAGSGFSMGSRGSRTFSMPAPTRTSPYGAAPFDRSMSSRAAPFGGMSQGMRGHPLAAGLLGGLVGAGIGGMLFGHGFMGGGMGLGGMLGLLLQIALIVFAVRWLLRRFAGAGARGMAGVAPAALSNGGYRQPNARTMSGGWGGNAPPLAIAAPDYRQFEQTLRDVQSAWTRSDVPGLQRLATPEMVRYFAEQLQDQSRRGVRNAVSDVRLERGDLSEAWSEGGRDYATVAMRYALLDDRRHHRRRRRPGRPSERVSVGELWTFVRVPGGNWALSAIQQAR